MKRSSISKKSLEPDKKSRNAFLLITLYRSGSTLTGELFNRNPNFLYYFEPLGKILQFPTFLKSIVDGKFDWEENTRSLSKVKRNEAGKVENLPKAIFGDDELTNTDLKVKMLNDSFHCIPPMAHEYEHVAPKPNGLTNKCLEAGICFYYMSTRRGIFSFTEQ